MLNLQWFDFVGFFGVLLVLLAYLGLQARRMRGDGFMYSFLNMIGALGILVSVVYAEKMNYSVLLIEGTWVLISIYGIYQSLVSRIRKPS